MTHDERQAIVFSVFAAIRRLVSDSDRTELEQHLEALTAAMNDHAAASYATGRAESATAAEREAHDRGKIAGMLAVEARADRCDLALIGDPAELRSVH